MDCFGGACEKCVPENVITSVKTLVADHLTGLLRKDALRSIAAKMLSDKELYDIPSNSFPLKGTS